MQASIARSPQDVRDHIIRGFDVLWSKAEMNLGLLNKMRGVLTHLQRIANETEPALPLANM